MSEDMPPAEEVCGEWMASNWEHTPDDGFVFLDDNVLEQDLDDGGRSDFDKREGNTATVSLKMIGPDVHVVRGVINRATAVQDVDQGWWINFIGVAFLYQRHKVGIRPRQNTIAHETGIFDLCTQLLCWI